MLQELSWKQSCFSVNSSCQIHKHIWHIYLFHSRATYAFANSSKSFVISRHQQLLTDQVDWVSAQFLKQWMLCLPWWPVLGRGKASPSCTCCESPVGSLGCHRSVLQILWMAMVGRWTVDSAGGSTWFSNSWAIPTMEQVHNSERITINWYQMELTHRMPPCLFLYPSISCLYPQSITNAAPQNEIINSGTGPYGTHLRHPHGFHFLDQIKNTCWAKQSQCILVVFVRSCCSTLFHRSRANPWPDLSMLTFAHGDTSKVETWPSALKASIWLLNFSSAPALAPNRPWGHFLVSGRKAFQGKVGGPPGQFLLQHLVLLMCLCCLLRSCKVNEFARDDLRCPFTRPST